MNAELAIGMPNTSRYVTETTNPAAPPALATPGHSDHWDLLTLGDVWLDAGTSTTAGVGITAQVLPADTFGTAAMHCGQAHTALQTTRLRRAWIALSTISAINYPQMVHFVDSHRVTLLQNEIHDRGGLSRDQIARGVGVSRRSLHSWASGATNPPPERLGYLEVLADVVRDINHAQLPGGVHSVINADAGGHLLDAIATGRISAANQWRTFLNAEMSPPAAVRIWRRDSANTRRPLHEAALQAYLRGELPAQKRSPTLRPESVYEQDLSRAAEVMGEPRTERRSGRGYGRP